MSRSIHTEGDFPASQESSAPAFSSGFTADYANVPPRQLLDLVLMSRRTAEITLRGKDGTEGRLRCVEGQVVEAAIDGASDLRYVEEVLEILSDNAQVSFSPEHSSTLGEALVLDQAEGGEPAALVKLDPPNDKLPKSRTRALAVDRGARGASFVALVFGLLIAAYVSLMEHRLEQERLATTSFQALKVTEPQSSPPQTASVVESLVPEPALYLELQTEPIHAGIWLDDVLIGHGQTSVTVDNVNSTHELRVEAEGFIPRHVAFLGTAPPQKITLVPLPRVTKKSKKRRRRSRARARRKRNSKKRVAKRTEPTVELIGDNYPDIELIEREGAQAEVIQ